MQLTPEQIHEFISKAIIESQIGQAVRDSIERVLKDLNEKYKNPIDDVIREHVKNMVREMLVKENFPEIQHRVTTALEKYVTQDIVDNLVEGALSRLNRY